MDEKERLTVDEAAHEVKLASRRIALLHLAFSRAAVRTLGEASGEKLITDAIKEYGTMIGTELRDAVMRQGLEATPDNYGAGNSRSLPRIGMHSGSETVSVGGEPRIRAYGCVMAEVWAEYGEEDLGRLYCYVDPAKFMAFNPAHTMAHVKARPSGDPFCEFCIRETTAKERSDFASNEASWISADSCEAHEGRDSA